MLWRVRNYLAVARAEPSVEFRIRTHTSGMRPRAAVLGLGLGPNGVVGDDDRVGPTRSFALTLCTRVLLSVQNNKQPFPPPSGFYLPSVRLSESFFLGSNLRTNIFSNFSIKFTTVSQIKKRLILSKTNVNQL